MMKKLHLALALCLALPLTLPAHAAEKKPVVKKAHKKTLKRSAAKAVEAVTPISDDDNAPLSPAQLAIAKTVQTGTIKCELGAHVVVTPDENKPGYFTISAGKQQYRVHPVESRTGAVRLEAPKAGVMWLQLGNKSMLLNQSAGQRIADDCQSSSQTAFAENMRKHPPKPLFEGADATK